MVEYLIEIELGTGLKHISINRRQWGELYLLPQEAANQRILKPTRIGSMQMR